MVCEKCPLTDFRTTNGIGKKRRNEIVKIDGRKTEPKKCVNNFLPVDTFVAFNIPSSHSRAMKATTILYRPETTSQFLRTQMDAARCGHVNEWKTCWKCKEDSSPKIYCTKIKFAAHRHWMAANYTIKHAPQWMTLSTTVFHPFQTSLTVEKKN